MKTVYRLNETTIRTIEQIINNGSGRCEVIATKDRLRVVAVRRVVATEQIEQVYEFPPAK